MVAAPGATCHKDMTGQWSNGAVGIDVTAPNNNPRRRNVPRLRLRLHNREQDIDACRRPGQTWDCAGRRVAHAPEEEAASGSPFQVLAPHNASKALSCFCLHACPADALSGVRD